MNKDCHFYNHEKLQYIARTCLRKVLHGNIYLRLTLYTVGRQTGVCWSGIAIFRFWWSSDRNLVDQNGGKRRHGWNENSVWAKQKLSIMVIAFVRQNWVSWSPKSVSLTLKRLNVFVYKTPKIDTNHRNIRSAGRNIDIFLWRRVLLPKNIWMLQDIHVLKEK